MLGELRLTESRKVATHLKLSSGQLSLPSTTLRKLHFVLIKLLLYLTGKDFSKFWLLTEGKRLLRRLLVLVD